jgi:hypothetical protein
MSGKRVVNPFYVLLVVTGLLFGVTAMAYGVMSTVALHHPAAAEESGDSSHGLMPWLDQHGSKLLMTEVAVLAAATLLAISTDRYWTRRAERKASVGRRSET